MDFVIFLNSLLDFLASSLFIITQYFLDIGLALVFVKRLKKAI